MNSRLVSRITSQLLGTVDQNTWFCLKSRLIIYYAQRGDLEEANKQVTQLRERFSVVGSARGAACVNLAEAIICFQSGATQDAVVKSRRAYALSTAASDDELICLSAACLAHFYSNLRCYEDAISLARTALEEPHTKEKFAIARASLVVADIYHLFADFSQAKVWYDSARIAAVDDGDEIMIGIILYNISTHRLNALRVSQMEGKFDTNTSARLSLEASSSSNFDLGVGSSAFPALLPILNAQVLTVRGNFLDAAEAFSHCIERIRMTDMQRLWPALYADYAWCLANLGREVDALALLSRIECFDMRPAAADDRALTFYRMSNTYTLLGDAAKASQFNEKMLADLAIERGIQAEAIVALKRAFS
jgi:tetratricopeptide (TPR) repeat protein